MPDTPLQVHKAQEPGIERSEITVFLNEMKELGAKDNAIVPDT